MDIYYDYRPLKQSCFCGLFWYDYCRSICTKERQADDVAAESDYNKDFNVIVMLSDNRINGVYGGLEFKDSVANFILNHDETKTVSGLSANIKYNTV